MNGLRITLTILMLELLCIGSLSSGTASDQQFRSAVSLDLGIPSDFSVLYQRSNLIYDVIEHDDLHIIWKFTGTTGDYAFVFADGRIAAASTVEFNIDTKNKLEKELSDIMDMLNIAGAGIPSSTRVNAFDSATYYTQEADTYHRIKYRFDKNFELILSVPDCTIEEARLTIEGYDECVTNCHGTTLGQHYYIDGKEISGCDCLGGCSTNCRREGISCGTFVDDNPSWYCSGHIGLNPVNIHNAIPYGKHTIKATAIDDSHIMYIEAITLPTTDKFVLYGDPGYTPWIDENAKSLDLQAFQEFLSEI